MHTANAYNALQVISHRHLSVIMISMLTQMGSSDKWSSSRKCAQLPSPQESQPAGGIFNTLY